MKKHSSYWATSPCVDNVFPTNYTFLTHLASAKKGSVFWIISKQEKMFQELEAHC